MPVWVTQFNSRAWFLCNPGTPSYPALLCSDNLATGGPLSRSQSVIITFGDTVNLTGAGVLTLTNIATGTFTQGLFVFKQAGQGTTNIFQITGDPALGTLDVQPINTSVSCDAPNTICSSPQGLYFVAPDGLRMIDTQGHVQGPIGFDGEGVCLPFIYSAIQSRMSAAVNSNTIRINTLNSLTGMNQDWCYDFVRKSWYGPHTFPSGIISAWGNTFITSPAPASGVFGFYQSDILPSSSSVYTELGAAMTCTYLSGYFPDRENLNMLSTVVSVFYQARPAAQTFVISAIDEDLSVLNSCSVTFSTKAPFSAMQVPWTIPVIFDRMAIQVIATAGAGLRMGGFLLEYEVEAYTVPAYGVQTVLTDSLGVILTDSLGVPLTQYGIT